MSVHSRYKDSFVSKILIGGLILVLILQVVSIIVKSEEELFNPLGDYPAAEILNPEGGSELPEVKVVDDLQMKTERCVEGDDDVHVLVNVRWTTVSPPGTGVQSTENAPLVREAGCNSNDYSVPIPDRVQARTIELTEEGKGPVIWKLAGYDTPMDKNGRPGAIREWESEPFVVTS